MLHRHMAAHVIGGLVQTREGIEGIADLAFNLQQFSRDEPRQIRGWALEIGWRGRDHGKGDAMIAPSG